MIMRYQRVSPDGQPSSFNNGRGGGDINGSVNANGALKVLGFEGKGLSRFRSPSKNHQYHISSTLDKIGCSSGDTEKNHHQEEASSQKAVGGDGLLQWGHRKRSRCSRNENGRIGGGLMVGVTNDRESLPSSSSSIQFLQRKQQQQATVNVPRISVTNSIMAPPPTTTSNGIPRGSVLKSSSKDNSSVFPNRQNNLEDRAGGVTNASPTRSIGTVGNGGGRSVCCRSKVRGRRSSPSSLAEKFCRRNPSSAKEEKINGGLCSSSSPLLQRREAIVDSAPQQSEQVVVSNSTKDDDNNSIKGTMIAGGGGTGEKANGVGGEANEWPKIFIPLSRKEKEEDFLVMKGTKLPHRPKKRPKTIDRVLQCCSPGMWLSDLTKGRYEVREKKYTKKQKRRGLKGMERVDGDSD